MALTRITSSVIKDQTITEGKFDTQYLNATGSADIGTQPITLESTLNIRVGQGATYFTAGSNKLTLTAPAATDSALELAVGGLTVSAGNLTLADNNTQINSPKLKLNNGTSSNPSLIFGDSTTTGISRVSSPEALVLSVGGSSLLSLVPTDGISLGSTTVKILTSGTSYTKVLGYDTATSAIEVGGVNNILRIKSGNDNVINVRSVNGSNQAYTNDENRIGINNDDPQATLDVTGSIRATSYQNIQTTDLPVIPISGGGTGITVGGLPEQLLRVNEQGTAFEYFSLNTGDVNNLSSFGVSGDGTIYRATALGVDANNKLVVSIGDYLDGNGDTVSQNVGTWRIGQTVKVFGVNTKNISQYDYTNSDSSSVYNQWTTSIDQSAQVTAAVGGSGGGVNYTYYVRLLNVDTGVVSSFHQLKHAGSGANTNVVANYPLTQFNEQRYNNLKLFRPDANHAILVYRYHNDISAVVSTAEGNAIAPSVHNANLNLIAIVGQRDIGSDINLGPIDFKDYGAFDRVTWGNKNTDGTIHANHTKMYGFPTTVLPNTVPTARAIAGYVERTVESVDYATKTITLSNSPDTAYDTVDTSNTTNINIAAGGVQVVHDDTEAIHAVIDDVIDKGLDSLYLTGGTYLVKRLDIPSNFSLAGAGKSCIIKKQYFDTSWNRNSNGEISRTYCALYLRTPEDATGTPSNTTSQPNKNITVNNIVIDGNYDNNIRLGVSASPESNALVYAGGIDNFSISGCDITNSVGDGLWIAEGSRVSVQNCFISDNSTTYTSFDNPLQATNCSVLKVSDSAFINNPGPADITTTEVVAFNSCIIRNSGTGIRTYGARSSNTENNLVLGPDDEWIPTTDLYDSDFNNINLNCYKTAGTGTNGPVRFTYVEENVAKNFTSAIFNTFVYTVNVDNNGNETLGANPLTYNVGGVNRSVLETQVYDAANGGVQVQIPPAALSSIPYRTIQGVVGINYNYIVYYVNATEEINIGDADNYNITGVVDYDQNSQQYTIKITAETVGEFTIGDIVTLQEHNPVTGYSLPSELEVRGLNFVNQAWNMVLYKADFNTFNANNNGGSITADPAARGYIKKQRTFTIAKGIIGVK